MWKEFKLISRATKRTLIDMLQSISKGCRNALVPITIGNVGKWMVRIFCIILVITIAVTPMTLFAIGITYGYIKEPGSFAGDVGIFMMLIVSFLWIPFTLGTLAIGITDNYEIEKAKEKYR